VILLLLGLLFIVVGWNWLRYRRERQAAAEIEAMGGIVQYWPRFHRHSFPAWLPELVGEESLKPFSDVSVILWGCNWNPTKLEKLDFDHLTMDVNTLGVQSLFLAGLQVDDSMLMKLQGLRSIEELTIEGTSISDKGLQYLAGWNRMESLCLSSNLRQTNLALANLKGMASLKNLHVERNAISDQEARDFMKKRRQPE
jgi:hypothetical protein